MKNDIAPLPTLRLDKWLWFARLARTRSLAARLCSEGRVTIGGRGDVTPHHAVRVGDVITVELPHERRRLIVRALGARRGPPAEAQRLYDEPTPPVRREPAAGAWVSLFSDDEPVFES